MVRHSSASASSAFAEDGEAWAAGRPAYRRWPSPGRFLRVPAQLVAEGAGARADGQALEGEVAAEGAGAEFDAGRGRAGAPRRRRPGFHHVLVVLGELAGVGGTVHAEVDEALAQRRSVAGIELARGLDGREREARAGRDHRGLVVDRQHRSGPWSAA